jgi:hypothetical protein
MRERVTPISAEEIEKIRHQQASRIPSDHHNTRKFSQEEDDLIFAMRTAGSSWESIREAFVEMYRDSIRRPPGRARISNRFREIVNLPRYKR